MNIPSPYFKDVPGIGDLELDEIIVDYDYPLLSVLTSERAKHFLCMCYDVSDAQRWIITPVFVAQLKALLRNEITLDAPFKAPDSLKILAEWRSDTKKDTYRQISAEEIPERCLPIAGEYLEAEPDEWNDYIAQLDKRQYASAETEFDKSQIVISILNPSIRTRYAQTDGGFSNMWKSTSDWERNSSFVSVRPAYGGKNENYRVAVLMSDAKVEVSHGGKGLQNAY